VVWAIKCADVVGLVETILHADIIAIYIAGKLATLDAMRK